MTGVVHHGPSGSYKTSAIVQRTIIPTLVGKDFETAEGETETKGRVTVTNIRGLNSIEKIEQAMEVTIHDDSEIIYVDPENGPRGWDAMRVFFHWAPIGALIAFDEAAKIYPKKRIRDFRQFDLPLYDADGNRNSEEYIKSRCPYWDGNYDRPETLEEAIDLHRHWHWDVYFSCTNIAKLHDEFRQNIEVAHRHKSLGELIPWKKNKWKEFSHDAEFTGKSISHHQGTPKEYKADLRVFDCYLSTKDGKAKLSPENRSVFRDPKLRLFGVFFLASIIFFVYFGVKVALGTPEVSNALELDTTPAESVPTQTPDNVDRHASAELPTEVRTQDVSTVDPSIKPKPKFIPLDAFHRYTTEDYQMSLGAVLTVVSTGKLHYRISVYSNDEMVDQFDQEQIEIFGYQQRYTRGGLLLTKEGASILVRPLSFLVSKKLPSNQATKGNS